MLALAWLIAPDSPFTPALILAVWSLVWIFLLKRYERRLPIRPIDPRRRRAWFLSGMAACGLLAVLGFVAANWILGQHLQP
jgi:hypothetical protein